MMMADKMMMMMIMIKSILPFIEMWFPLANYKICFILFCHFLKISA